jgi:hypothetical protein
MFDMTKNSSTSKFLPSSSKFPVIQREAGRTQTTHHMPILLAQEDDCTTRDRARKETAGFDSTSVIKAHST